MSAVQGVDMNQQLFTVIPSEENADQLQQLTMEIICQKLFSIIGQVGEQMSFDFCHEINALIAEQKGIANPVLFY